MLERIYPSFAGHTEVELAPRSFEVPLHMPEFMAPALQPDGRVLIMALLARDDLMTADVDEELWEVEFEMAAPWAKDAHGNNVTTWYTLDGTTLTQHIAPTESTVFPVVADLRCIKDLGHLNPCYVRHVGCRASGTGLSPSFSR